MRTNYLLLGTVGWRPSPLYLNRNIIKLIVNFTKSYFISIWNGHVHLNNAISIKFF